MITPDGVSTLYQSVVDNVASATALVNGVDKPIAIQKFEMTSTSIKVYIYLDETIVGTITRYRLIQFNGKIFLEKLDNVTKDNTRGLLTLFEIDITEV